MITLDWEHVSELADALAEKYPMTDRLQLDRRKLKAMLAGLQILSESDIDQADEDILDAILMAWRHKEEDVDRRGSAGDGTGPFV